MVSNVIKVIGFDPSLQNWGWAKGAVYLDSDGIDVYQIGLISPDLADSATKKVVRKNSDDLRRARALVTGISDAIKSYQPTIAFVEVPVGSQSARAMASYGVCIGVLASLTIPIIEVTPTEVKLTTVGSKTASKDEMIQWAYQRHSMTNGWFKRKGELTKKNEHCADAIASIYAGIKSMQFLQLMAMRQSIAA